MAAALRSGRCPKRLTIDFGVSKFGDSGVYALADALTSDHCPEGLTLIFFKNEFTCITNEGVHALVQAFKSGQCQRGTQVEVGALRRLEKIKMDDQLIDFAKLSQDNDRAICEKFLALATVLGSSHTIAKQTSVFDRLPLDLLRNITNFLFGQVSVDRVLNSLALSFVALVRKNEDFSSYFLHKHRHAYAKVQHQFDQRFGLSLWRCHQRTIDQYWLNQYAETSGVGLIDAPSENGVRCSIS